MTLRASDKGTRAACWALCFLAIAGCGGLAPPGQRAHEATPCVQGNCAEGYSCHYEHERDGGTAQRSVCRPEVGRCNSSVDCNPSQICFRNTARLGTCGQREY
ncbi:MAG: hypothetical protein RLZZ450_2283 [Pseudomonadota bacterium]|jgi:hypothetical protein